MKFILNLKMLLMSVQKIDQKYYNAGSQPINSKERYDSMSKRRNILYSCEQCTLVFQNKSKLKYHVESVHEGIIFTCELCEFKVYLKCVFKKHMKLHHIKNFDLSYRPKRYKNQKKKRKLQKKQKEWKRRRKKKVREI